MIALRQFRSQFDDEPVVIAPAKVPYDRCSKQKMAAPLFWKAVRAFRLQFEHVIYAPLPGFRFPARS
jgi:hypothetical protein